MLSAELGRFYRTTIKIRHPSLPGYHILGHIGLITIWCINVGDQFSPVPTLAMFMFPLAAPLKANEDGLHRLVHRTIQRRLPKDGPLPGH